MVARFSIKGRVLLETIIFNKSTTFCAIRIFLPLYVVVIDKIFLDFS